MENQNNNGEVEFKKERAREIAQTILNQINATADWSVIGSWGAHNWLTIGEGHIENLNHFYLGGLLFTVNGHKHKGQVLVTLAGNDTYTLTIGNLRKGEMKIKEQIKELYWEDLTEVIDEKIERLKSYAY